MTDPYLTYFVCKNKECEHYDKVQAPVHSDNFILTKQEYYGISIHTGKLTYFNFPKNVLKQSLCECKHQMEVDREERVDYVLKPEIHKEMTFATADAKKGRHFYTRWKDKKGGKPEFNPVTKTGGKTL